MYNVNYFRAIRQYFNRTSCFKCVGMEESVIYNSTNKLKVHKHTYCYKKNSNQMQEVGIIQKNNKKD